MKALFLDRDGIINYDFGYVIRRQDFQFFSEIFPICHYFQEKGFAIFVITNQAGIARGYYSISQFQSLTEWMVEQMAKEKVYITRVYYCPYYEKGSMAEFTRPSYDRKPNPGMLFQAQKEFQIDLANSVLIGDKPSDIEAGKAAGLAKNYLIDNQQESSVQDFIFQSHQQLLQYLQA